MNAAYSYYHRYYRENFHSFACLPLHYAVGLQALGQLPLKSVFVMTTLADASMHYFAERTMKSFHVATKVSQIASIIRFAALLWSSGYLMQELSKKVSFLPLSGASVAKLPFTYGLTSWAAMVAGMSMAAFIVSFLNYVKTKHQNFELEKVKAQLQEDAQSSPELQRTLDSVKCSPEKPFGVSNVQWAMVLQTTVNVALTFFVEAKLPFAAATVFNLYALYLLTNRNWLGITREALQDTISVQIEYRPVFVRDDRKPKTDPCSICQEVPAHRYYLCENHSFDNVCLTRLFIEAISKFRIVNDPVRIEHKKGDRVERVTYEVFAQELLKPKCPVCRKIPSQNSLAVWLFDEKTQKMCSTSIVWLHYAPEQTISLKINAFGQSNDQTFAEGTLPDGSLAYFPSALNRRIIGTTVSVIIRSVGVENGQLVLACNPPAL